MSKNVFGNFGVEVTLKEYDDFLKVKETLTRIGIASRKSKTLYQSCHILHKQGKYAIIHFKELFALDNKPNDFSDEDAARRNKIARLLEEWGLVELVEKMPVEDSATSPNLTIVPFRDKSLWKFESKYTIGKK